jgi:hypothetical protein
MCNDVTSKSMPNMCICHLCGTYVGFIFLLDLAARLIGSRQAAANTRAKKMLSLCFVKHRDMESYVGVEV